MSNARARRRSYTHGYLQSVAWFRRRDRWFDEEQARVGVIRCAVCEVELNRRKAELHHVTYERLTKTASGWHAGEEHEDLMAMHRACHEWVHRLMDSGTLFRDARNRLVATNLAIVRLRSKLRRHVAQQAAAVQAGETNE